MKSVTNSIWDRKVEKPMSSQAPQKSPKPKGNNHLLREPRSRVEAVKVSELSRNLPRAMVGKIMNSVAANMPALPVPNRDRVHAFTSQEALDRWGDRKSTRLNSSH